MGFFKTILFMDSVNSQLRMCVNGSKFCNSRLNCDKCLQDKEHIFITRTIKKKNNIKIIL